MKTVALISGGKDSCFNMLHCHANGHDIVALANLHPPYALSSSSKDSTPKTSEDELDSFMFQTVGHDVIQLYAECMDIPLFRREITGTSKDIGPTYQQCEGDEVEDLYHLLQDVLKAIPDVKAVAVGAILSNYQRVRVEHVCSRLGLTCLSYLWRRTQKELLAEMVECGMNAVLIKVAAIDLSHQHLGKSIKDMFDYLCKLEQKYGSNVCGEGGEYETLTLDCPIFQRRIVLDETQIITHSDDAFAPVAYLKVIKAHTEPKESFGLNDELKSKLLRNKSIDLNEYPDLGPLDPPVSQQPVFQFDSTTDSTSTSTNNHAILSTNASPFITFGTICHPVPNSPIEEEALHLFNHITTLLTTHKLTWSDIIMTHLYVSSMSDFGRVNSVYGKLFTVNPPSRVCVEVRVDKIMKGARIAVDLVGARNGKEIKKTMHVQGVSYWAPANIGPYSQTQLVSSQTFVAGQIALTPHTMTMPSFPCLLTNLHTEIIQVLLSLRNVLNAVDVGYNHVVLAVVYIAKEEYLGPSKNGWKWALNHLVGNEQDEEEREIMVPTAYVVVPTLPRNAKVEWAVITSSTAEEEEIKERKFWKEKITVVDEMVVDVEVSELGNAKCLVLNARMNDPSKPITQSEVTQLTDKFTSAINSHLQSHKIVSIRCLYNHQVPFTVINTQMNLLSSNVHGNPAVAYVPVENGIATLCVHAIKTSNETN